MFKRDKVSSLGTEMRMEETPMSHLPMVGGPHGTRGSAGTVPLPVAWEILFSPGFGVVITPPPQVVVLTVRDFTMHSVTHQIQRDVVLWIISAQVCICFMPVTSPIDFLNAK